MLIPFNVQKVAQACAVLLKTEEHRRMGRLRLLKLLYIADRESLVERYRPITGDTLVAMDHGPVLSQTYNLIKGEAIEAPEWDRYFRSGGRDVVLAEDPGVGKLTRKEIQKLHDVAARFQNCDDYEIAVYTHGFEEWVKNRPAPGSSKRISLDDLLDATHLTAIKDQLKSDAANERLADHLLNAPAQ